MIKEIILKDFPTWDAEKQLSEYQGYKALGDYSPFNESDYQLMEMVMNNPNAEVECKDGVCELVTSVTQQMDNVNTMEALELNVAECLDKLEEAVITLNEYKNNLN